MSFWHVLYGIVYRYLDVVEESLYGGEPAAEGAAPDLELQLGDGDGAGLRLQHVTVQVRRIGQPG